MVALEVLEMGEGECTEIDHSPSPSYPRRMFAEGGHCQAPRPPVLGAWMSDCDRLYALAEYAAPPPVVSTDSDQVGFDHLHATSSCKDPSPGPTASILRFFQVLLPPSFVQGCAVDT